MKTKKMHTNIDEQTEVKEDTKTDESIGNDQIRNLVVYNDDFNTFDHVIQTLIKVCKHDSHQAEQCTYLIHYKGKCTVKKGDYETLKPMKEGISLAGLKVTIE